jgi:sulfonate transport system substrate-binding protein
VRFAGVVAAVATACAGTGALLVPGTAGAQASKPDLSNVTINVTDSLKSAQTLLQASGQLTNVPYTINWIETASASIGFAGVKGGSVDYVVGGDSTIVTALAGGVPVKVVAALLGGANDEDVLVPATSPIKSVKGLVGKTIAVNEGSGAQEVALEALQKAHIPLTAVQWAYLQPPAALAAFSQGNLQAWATFDPANVTTAVEKYNARVLVPGKSVQQYAPNLVTVSDAALADPGKRAALGDFLSRLQKAYLWADSHNTQYFAQLSQITGLPVATVAATWKNSGPDHLVQATKALEAHTQVTSNLFAKAAVIPTAVEVSQYWDNQYKNVLPASAA